MRWIVDPRLHDKRRISVLALLDDTNSAIKQLLTFARFDGKRTALNRAFLKMGAVFTH
jgi:hypothetical protein